MRLGLLSDIHCNAPQLEVALARLDDCDEVLCAGDLMYQFRWEPRVLDLLRERQAKIILGNHDVSLLGVARDGLIPFTPGLEELASLPRQLELELDGLRLGLFHGTPWDRTDDGCVWSLLPADRAGLQRASASGFDVLVLGHTHVPMRVQAGSTTIVNPGSCGEPGREGRAYTCATLELPSRDVTFHNLPRAT